MTYIHEASHNAGHTERTGGGGGRAEGLLRVPVGTIEIVVGGFLHMTCDALPSIILSRFL